MPRHLPDMAHWSRSKDRGPTNTGRRGFTLVEVLLVIVLAALLAAIGWYLFRTTKQAMGDGSTLWVKYWMGRPVQAELDRDGDGKVDWIATLSDNAGIAETKELRVDQDRDGTFEYYFRPAQGDAFLAEVDLNADGTFDNQLTGDAARELYCKWAPCGPAY